ncbi:DUF1048 domain-containing protein [Deinococcus sp. Arct2-2]|uniref:DUF1048 domain-containing protein n=1 Tax=Deinococcus sp. Arct2-2 TaxID=2568653 RepID=UPI0010A38F9F|nr:DUF1048 domain-containing protein [Deinococcus sp. Arct2-2]THF67918.1 DUF1048 domain-containing protein [Deinococcus sp. Arct2-2]
MHDFWRTITGDKKEWNRMEARAKALPRDFLIVYGEIKKYMWNFSAGTGMDMVPIFRDLIELFETSAADGKGVIEITGEDVAAFCDELLRNARTYTEDWREALNRNVMQKLRNEGIKK